MLWKRVCVWVGGQERTVRYLIMAAFFVIDDPKKRYSLSRSLSFPMTIPEINPSTCSMAPHVCLLCNGLCACTLNAGGYQRNCLSID